jgi:FtsX-like permease family
VISLGLRLTLSGGREAAIRLILLVVAVGLGAGLLLTAVAGINAVNYQNDRYAWLNTTASSGSAHDPLWWLLRGDRYDGHLIGRVDVAATGPDSPVPPGIPHDPGAGQYYASPAMIRLLDSAPADQLADRYPGHLAGTIGNQALPGPNSLVIIIGHPAAQLAAVPGAVRASAISTFAPSSCDGKDCQISQGIKASGIDLIFAVVALAMLFPVLIFIATATRLSAARREQRFAAIRLAGATPRQVSLIAGVESTAAAVLGVALGFALFLLVRIPIASIPFTGTSFFPGDLRLSLPDVLVVAIGVPAAAAAAARLALRRVHISPLGVSRRVTPKPPGAWRVLPLLAGLAELGSFVVNGRPPTTQGEIQAFVPGFLLIMAGLVVAGPWLTMAGARLMVRQTRRPGTLIAARRLADNPRAGFRAVSGLVLALFVTTVAVVLITTQNAKGSQPADGPGASGVLVDQMTGPGGAPGSGPGPDHGPVPSAALLTQLGGIDGGHGVMTIRYDRGLTVPAAMLGYPRSYGQSVPGGLVSCAELARFPELGRCPMGAAVAVFPALPAWGADISHVTWPAANVPADRLASLPAASINAGTDGSVAATEQARTLLETTYPNAGEVATIGEQESESNGRNAQYQQLADVVILASLPIAGCTLAASIAAGLADRKRPFSMLRLAGTPLTVLRRVVALESAVPLLVSAVVSIGIGFAASAMYATMQLERPMVAPDIAYYVITVAGIAISLGIIAATMPLLNRITGPEVARNE